ncbi:hypothetical protein EDB92DRAFT_1842897 [Lactarius akahatsu]|uniref:Uncharacterized protein n=1 Tax=Lactarius akahatsu TaxID=416441 RepID=A0AAD4LKY3_9AGAM|nr:hypothetical protein EDB92DRAFT_1842897 [Lactarius akahatsu]
MRSTLPLCSPAHSPDQTRTLSTLPQQTTPEPTHIPTIRLISATPSAVGSVHALGDPLASQSPSSSPPTPLAPKQDMQAPRRRLVPKKSRLGLLVSGKGGKTNGKHDLSDVVRRVGGSATTASIGKAGFEIYVDPISQPHHDTDEVLMVKKKKSRASLSALKWGALGEVTNSAQTRDTTQTVRLKNEDKEKWWTIGRGRKDSKDKRVVEKDAAGTLTENSASRARFNSLDSRLVLNVASKTAERQAQPRSASASESSIQGIDPLSDLPSVVAPSYPAPEDDPTPPLLAPPNSTTGSIAIRAMRSMRSVARLTSWTNGKPTEKENKSAILVPAQRKDDESKRTKTKGKRKFELGRDQTVSRLSGSSSEAGVSSGPHPQPSATRKPGVLGLGFPSGFRFGTVRSSSAGSSDRISCSSAGDTPSESQDCSSSTVSAASSLRPRSAMSRISSSSSSSVKWVEDRLETVRVACRRERRDGTQRDSTGARSRAKVTDVLLEKSSRPVLSKSTSPSSLPTLAVEEANRHSARESEPGATPNKQIRIRPASDQMIGMERLRGIRGVGEGTLSALDAATNELASLISRLDLEATPGTPRGTLRLSPSFTTLLESPRLKGSPEKSSFPRALALRPSTASLTSLRPYPQPRTREAIPDTQRYGQQIAPWPVSPSKPMETSSTNFAPLASSTVVGSSIPSPTPGQIVNSTTGYESSFVFRPLRPGKANQPVAPVPVPLPQGHFGSARTEPVTFESKTVSMKTSVGLLAGSQKESTLGRTFRKVMSTLSLRAKESERSVDSEGTGILMSSEARKNLGLAGTLGGSTSSRNPDLSLETDNPDSDIPNELQDILTGGNAERLDDSEDTIAFPLAPFPHLPPSPGLPPECPLPTPMMSQTCAARSGGSVNSTQPIVEGGDDGDDESDSSSLEENDTKKSFDFTGELKKLSSFAGTHRHSFVEQLENAFHEDIPPVPVVPSFDDSHVVTSTSVPPLLPSPEIVVSKKAKGTISYNILQDEVEKPPALSKPSYGQLNLNFKFGGHPLSAKTADASPLTLSDIIPSPAHARSLSLGSAREDDSTQQIPEAMSTASPDSSVRRQFNSDPSSTRPVHEDSRADAYSSHSRASSQSSFRGFESFDEIRRGFEFVDNRPAFYPPPFDNRRNQQLRDSMMSIASVSSYGFVINPGLKDPFDYGYESRPVSGDMSTVMTMSTSVDDTFSFIRRGPHRKRVDSDSSSFYFRAPGMSHISRPHKGHARQDSAMSAASVPPPVSIYNRSFGAHRRIDSGSSIGSVLQAHPSYGFSGGNRSSWAPGHKREMSADSVMSDVSVRMSRPTLGDKMLDSRHDYCLPLASIAASPPESEASGRSYEHIRRRGSFDSIAEKEHHWRSRDSIINQGNTGSLANSDSVFGRVGSLAAYSSPNQLQMNDIRPFSLISADGDSSDPKREDDTMISMIGGGRVRRRSVGSFVESSPLFFRVGKRKIMSARRKQHDLVSSHEGLVEPPSLTRRIENSPRGLGEERMMSARQGLLSRNSLEEHCLSADGIDTSFTAKPVFSRPIPASRSRSGTNSSISSGIDTPPLSSSGETSSVASDSISSIDLSRVNLSLTSYPSIVQPRTRIRSRGSGHRRRISGIRISRTSVYETIEEEMSAISTPVLDCFPDSVKAPLSPVIDDNVIVVDPDDTSPTDWDERGIAALRRYYTLKDEADVTISESKQAWLDTPFSVYAVQSFEPPAHRSGMRALLEHSRQTYGSLPAELRRIRSRTSSRPTPYPQPQRTVKISLSPSTVHPVIPTSQTSAVLAPSVTPALIPQALQQRPINPNTVVAGESSLVPGKNAKVGSGPFSQSRIGLDARRNTPGRAKRSVGKENKENTISSGVMTAPGDGLRLNRPRPRGRLVPTRSAVAIGA